MRVEVARDSAPGVCIEGIQSDPASRGGSEFTGGKEGGELRKFSVEAVHFTFNTKGLGGGEEKDVILIWWADREWRRAAPAFWKLPFVFNRFYEGFQVFKGFHGLFFKKGRCYPEAKVPDDLRRCYRENIFTGKTWDGVSGKESTEEREIGVPVRCRAVSVRAMGWKQNGKEGREEREIGVPVRCRAVTVRVNGVETVWEGGYGGARDRSSGQVSSGDGEGKWGGNSMGRRERRSARSEFRSGVER